MCEAGQIGSPLRTQPHMRRVVIAVITALAAVYVVGRLVVPFADGAAHAVLRWGFAGLLYGAAAVVCWLRVIVGGRDRLAWTLVAVGVTLYVAGSVVVVVDGSADTESAPLAAHLGWLLFYPSAYTGLVVLARATLRPFTLAFALDGVLVALALAAVAAAALVPQFGNDFATMDLVAGLSFPAGDLLLLGFSLWIALLAGWRTSPMWRMLVYAFALLLLSDISLAVQATTSTFGEDAISSIAYPLGLALIGVAAWQERGRTRELRADVTALLILPACAVGGVLLVLVIGEPLGLAIAAEYLCFAVLVLAFIRMALVAGHLIALQEGKRFERGFEEATIGMAIIDEHLRWVRVNPALASMLGTTPRALTGGSVLDATPEHLHPLSRRAFAESLRTGDPIVDVRGQLVRRDGRRVNLLVTGSVIEGDDGAPQFFAQLRDITAELRAGRRTEAVARLTRAALDEPDVGALLREFSEVVKGALPAALAAVLVTDGPDGDTRVASMPGPIDAQLQRDVAKDNGQRARTIATGQPVVANDLPSEDRFVPSRWLLDHGIRRTLSVPVTFREGTSAVLAAHRGPDDPAFGTDDVRFMEAVANVLASALERAHTEAEHRHLALHDPLTGLANRTLLSAHVDHALAAAERQDERVALLLVDLDRFKGVNDTMGHSVGDQLLVTVAERLRHHARGGDLVARLGGDEFVVVFDAVGSVHDVVHVARRLLAAIAEPMEIAGRELDVTGSVGIVVAGGADGDPEGLLRDADVAMYRAKAGGGGRYELFDADLRASVLDRLAVERDLRRAVDRGELALYLQPLIDLGRRRPVGFEALVRWDRPGHGLVSPASFIGVAEETGLIVPVGDWVLREACRQIAALNATAGEPILLSVNLSARQLTEDLILAVRSALAAEGLAPELLTLEITESFLIEEHGAMAVLDAVRKLGVALALDDFGTGYSSLSALQRHAVDTLKLDRTMVSSVATSPTAAAVARAAVEMAGALGLDVVAEGIEDVEQLRIVRDLGCQVAQGYLFARPMPAVDAAAYLRDESWSGAFAAALPSR